MKFNALIIAGLAVTLFTTSCRRESSEDVNQDKIYTKYRMEYDDNTDKTTIRAVFRLSDALGVKIRLDDPAEITVNDRNLDWKSTYAYYQNEEDGWVASGTYRFVNNDREVLTNTLAYNSTISFPIDLTELYKSESYVLYWDGDPLLSGESVRVTLKSASSSFSTSFTASATGARSVTINKSRLTDIPLGAATLSMYRESSQDLDESTSAGGVMETKFTARSIAITINE